jgi:hypothetical protein
MPFRTVLGSDTRYGLICFGPDGAERRDDPDGRDGLMSACLLSIAAREGATNVFLFSHGWMGDVPAAVDQYDRWIEAFIGSRSDLQRAGKVFPGFRPLFIGLHWPSLPWGNEEIGDGSFAAEDERPGPDELYRSYVERLGDTPEIRVALETIFDEARSDAAPDQLSGRARQAFLDLNQALGLGSAGLAGPPDTDREPFDPDAALAAGSDVDFGGAGDVFGGVLGVLRLCSYWTMKKRARTVGEHGMHAFVNDLQRATAVRNTRVHLVGHSFGTIVVSSILGGPRCDGLLERPIDSVFLAQGAVSLWSYAESIPYDGAGAGYFHKVIAQGKIRGPLVTTQSRFDLAVGVQYPRACLLGSPGEVAFDAPAYPKYGAVGAFGFQGLSGEIKVDSAMLPADGEYRFEPGKIHNLEASQFICKGDGSSGAHSDIAGPEVAHAIWQAAFAGG